MDEFQASNQKFGYNMSPTAGSLLGFKMPESGKQKIRMALFGKKKTLEHRMNLSRVRKGRKLTPEHIANIAKGRNVEADRAAQKLRWDNESAEDRTERMRRLNEGVRLANERKAPARAAERAAKDAEKAASKAAKEAQRLASAEERRLKKREYDLERGRQKRAEILRSRPDDWVDGRLLRRGCTFTDEHRAAISAALVGKGGERATATNRKRWDAATLEDRKAFGRKLSETKSAHKKNWTAEDYAADKERKRKNMCEYVKAYRAREKAKQKASQPTLL